MAVDFLVKFAGVPAIQCQLHDTDLADRYLDLLKNQYSQDSNPIFRDPQRYTVDYFKELVIQAKQILGWDWQRDNYNIETTTLLHKDIERYLALGYENIPKEHDHILDELHFCLHSIQASGHRTDWLQVEWFNNSGFTLNEDEYPAKIDLEFGDIRLQNPYVGHHPLYLYEQKDFTNINQTCRFHDFVKPGINIVIANRPIPKFDWNSYLSWFQFHAPDFVNSKGVELLKKFTGHPIVGSVVNKKDLEELIKQPIIEFEHISFV